MRRGQPSWVTDDRETASVMHLTFANAKRLLVLAVMVSAAATAASSPPKIDLDTFDGLKRTVQLSDGETLAYLTMGDPGGPPVVLIHGYTDNARDWVPLIPYLSKHFYLVVVDLRGHGRSSKPDCCYTLPDFAYDIVLLLDKLGVRKADIVGHSLGSMIAQVFAETWPERTGKVILISSTGGPPAGAQPRKPQFDFAARIRQLKEPLDPDSPFMVAWWDSPTPVDADFIRRQRRDSAGIPLRVWLAVLDQGAGRPGRSATYPAATQSADLADLGQLRSHHGARGARHVAPGSAASPGPDIPWVGSQPLLGRSARLRHRDQHFSRADA